MKLILKDIPKIDHLFVGGEPHEMYDKRRMTIESDSYVLQGSDQRKHWKIDFDTIISFKHEIISDKYNID